MARVVSTTLAIALLLMTVVTAARPKWHQLTPQYTYEQYLSDFDKNRIRSRDATPRKALFEAELRSVLEHNANERATFKRTVNKFSDWTRGELSQLRMHADLESLNDVTAAKPKPLPPRQSARKAFDWRRVTPTVLTTVKDQGGCGGCWAHAITESIESAVAINSPGGDHLFAFAQQQLISCVPPANATLPNNVTVLEGGCSGFMPNLALDWITAAPFLGGFAEEWENPYRDYWNGLTPYNASMNTNAQCEAWMSDIPRPLGVVKGYDWVPSNDGAAFEDALINKGPIVVIMAVYNDMFSYDSGLYSNSACDFKNGTIPPSHAVNLVGFGYDEEHKADYWILRNSWSAAWGEAGYARMLRPKQEPCGTMWLPANNCTRLDHWVATKSCGMCGLLTYGLVPRL